MQVCRRRSTAYLDPRRLRRKTSHCDRLHSPLIGDETFSASESTFMPRWGPSGIGLLRCHGRTTGARTEQARPISGSGQSETNVTTEPWSAVEWIADADLTRASFYWDSVPHCRNPPSACQVRGRAIPCSDCAKQRHDIIPNRLALAAQESVSGVTGATAQVNLRLPRFRGRLLAWVITAPLASSPHKQSARDSRGRSAAGQGYTSPR